MRELTASDRLDRVAFDLNGRQVIFVRVGDDHYAAELDGKRLPIRKERHDKNEYGIEIWSPRLSEGDTANIDSILPCLSLGAVPTPISQGVELDVSDNWGHYRQWMWLTISITIAESGKIEINEDILEQDGSYY
jgi:hypothetical protein